MENTSEQAANPPVAAPLVRPAGNRIISGSAAGLANKLGVSTNLVRGAWVLLAFTGIGIPLYALAWLLIPGEGESQSVGEKWLARLGSSQGWIGVVLVVIAISVLAPALPFVDGGILIPTILLAGGILLYQQNFTRAPREPRQSTTIDVPRAPRTPPTPKPPPSPLGQITIGTTVIGLGALALIDRATPAMDAAPRHYLALAATILGLGVLAGTFVGRARWLIPFGLLLIPATAGAGIVEYENVARDQILRPTTFAELDSFYELGVGQLVIDLTNLPWDGETVTIDGSVGVGRIELILPPDVAIEATTEVGIGASLSPLDTQGGLGIDFDYALGDATAGTVVTNLEVGIGEIEVNGSSFDGFEGGIFFDPTEDLNITASSEDSLENFYATEGGSDLTLDLTELTLEGDRMVVVSSEAGDIHVTIPDGVSYRITASGPDLQILDSEVEDGTFVGESVTRGQPVLSIEATSTDGTITIEKGSRS